MHQNPTTEPITMRMRRGYLTLTTALLIWWLEPTLAGNKFETISTGVTGSGSLKRAGIEVALYAVGGVFVFSALLAVLMPHRNPLFLNYVSWKQSAAMFLIFGLAAIGGGLLLR